jgi:protease-4
MSAKWEIDPLYGLQHLARFMQAGEGTPARRLEGPQLRALELSTSGEIQQVEVGVDESGEALSQRIAHITMSGPMMLDGGACDYGVRDTIRLVRLADSRGVSGIVLEIDSGGGESTAGTELQNAIRDASVPVVVYTQMLASAALRASLPATAIYAAHASADIGSIGSYISFDRKLLSKIQKRIGYIYAEQSTEKNADFRALLEGKEDPLREYVTTGAQVFIDEVEAYRPGMRRTAEQKSSMQAGALFNAADAAQMGLIDGIATLGQVLEAVLRGQFTETFRARTAPRNQNHAGLSPANYTTAALAERQEANHDPMLPTYEGDAALENQAVTPTAAAETQHEDSALAQRIEALEQSLTEQATTIASQNDTITELRQSLSEACVTVDGLQTKVATLKVGGTPALDTNNPADRGQFETVRRVDNAKSKY